MNTRKTRIEAPIATWAQSVIASVLLAVLAAPAWPGDKPDDKPDDLASRSLEDLMNIEVTSVSKKEQKLSKTAAAIFVITAEDIRRSGATKIPDLLRMVPGMDVAQINGSTWAISARGFNGQFSNKLLVMIDQRVVYTSTFAGVFWDVLDLPLEDIDRIEVIRGPGGTIWGANAVNGVISIFTKKANATPGALVEAGGGNLEQGFGTTQYGGKINDETAYRVYAKYFNVDHMLDPTGQSGADGWNGLRGGFRVDKEISSKDALAVQGSIFSGREGEFGFGLPSVTSPSLVPIAEQIHSTDGFVQLDWTRTHSKDSDSSFIAAYGRFTRDDQLNPEKRDTWDLAFRHHSVWGERQDIVWGVGYRYTTDQILGSLTVSMSPAKRHLNLYDAFLQDEIRLTDRIYLTVGTKIGHNDYSGIEFMPSVRATWSVSEHQMLWTAVSRALRTPSRNDTNLVLNLGTGGTPDLQRILGNPSFDSEQLIGYEAGYRGTVGNRLSVDAAMFISDYDHLQTTEPQPPFFEEAPAPPHEVQPFTYRNLMYGETHGVEVTAKWKPYDRWTISPGYAFEELHMHTDPGSQDMQTKLFIEGASPRHSAQLRSHVDLRSDLAWDAAAYFVDRLTDQGPLSNVTIPAYTRLDTKLTWKVSEAFSFSAVGQNLLRDHHSEFIDINGSLQSGQIKRSGYLQVSWRF